MSLLFAHHIKVFSIRVGCMAKRHDDLSPFGPRCPMEDMGLFEAQTAQAQRVAGTKGFSPPATRNKHCSPSPMVAVVRHRAVKHIRGAVTSHRGALL